MNVLSHRKFLSLIAVAVIGSLAFFQVNYYIHQSADPHYYLSTTLTGGSANVWYNHNTAFYYAISQSASNEKTTTSTVSCPAPSYPTYPSAGGSVSWNLTLGSTVLASGTTSATDITQTHSSSCHKSTINGVTTYDTDAYSTTSWKYIVNYVINFQSYGSTSGTTYTWTINLDGSSESGTVDIFSDTINSPAGATNVAIGNTETYTSSYTTFSATGFQWFVNGVAQTVNASSMSFKFSANGTFSIYYVLINTTGYAIQSPTTTVIVVNQSPPSLPSGITQYIQINVTNFQSVATPNPYQQVIKWPSSQYSAIEAANLDNMEFFYHNATIIDSWMENNASNTAGQTVFWLKLNSIPASLTITIYAGFASTSTNLLNGNTVGEAPQLSSTYGQYDNGANIFIYYNVKPASTTGWTISGSAGLSTSAPSGSYFSSSNAYYANSASGDYMYSPISGLNSGEIISFDVYTTGLGDLFFLANSAGAGQMGRLDGRGGTDYSGLATTSSWTVWAAPSSGLSLSRDIWYKADIVIPSSGNAQMYFGSASTSLSVFGSAANSLSVSNNGNYVGLIGDGLGSSYVTYWNSFIIRSYPPNGVMPSVTIAGEVVPSAVPSGITQYVQVTITNSQSVNTANPYNQMVNWPSSQYTSIESSTMSNVEWFYSDGSIIPSWMQNGNSNTATQTTFWLKLNGIAASSSEVIYIGFASTSTNLLNTVTGEAPQLSSTYGQYDSGSNVFQFYDNFAGTALNTAKWQTITSGSGTETVSNGITVSESVLKTNMFVASKSTYLGIADGLITSQNTASFRGTGMELGTALPTGSGFVSGFTWLVSTNSQPGDFMQSFTSASVGSTIASTPTVPGTPYILSAVWSATGAESELVNYNTYLTASNSSFSLTSTYVILYAGSDGSNIGTIKLQYVLDRSLLPNNVMPSVTIVKSYPYSVILSNGQNYFSVSINGRGSNTIGAPGQSSSIPGIQITYEQVYTANVYLWLNQTLPSGLSIAVSTTYSGTQTVLTTSPYDLVADNGLSAGSTQGIWVWFSSDNNYPTNVTVAIEIQVG